MKYLIYLLSFLLLSACKMKEGEEVVAESSSPPLGSLSDLGNFKDNTERVDALFSFYANKFKEDHPIWATSMGYEGYEGRWSDWTLERVNSEIEIYRSLLSVCDEIDVEQLNPAIKTYLDILTLDIEEMIAYYNNEMYFTPVSQQGGVHQYIPNVIKRHPKNNSADMENLFKLMETADVQIFNTFDFLREGMRKGITNPKVTMKGVPDQIEKMLEGEGTSSVFYQNFDQLEAFSEEDAEMYRAKALRIIDEKIMEAYRQMLDLIVDEYIPACRETIALSDLPNGQEKYKNQLENYTTTDMTAREIHELGLSEVNRIKAEMEKVKNESGFSGDLNAFNEFLRTDPQFFHNSREELLVNYRDICKRADPELMKLFGKLPRQTYGVIPVPEYLEKYYTTARYERGSDVNGIPGYFYANTYAIETRPKWEMEALSLHEAVPGHHLQIAIEQEIEDQPEFKKFISYTVYIEGWGLYAESLGEEMDFYRDPYSKYGQLTYEMWRAIRLVVDPGIHSLGWTREQAIDYFLANAPKTRNDVEVEVDRYIGWPGQACAYKIGELKFKELRRKATEQLGDKFDIREFHDLVLSKGSVPLNVLDQLVDDWIDSKNS